MNTREIISFIENSNSFDEVRDANVLPEPDQDDGFYFVSYSHKDYKLVLPDIVNYFDSGLKIWYDRFLESGKSWTSEVHKKIASYYCKGIIFYITKNFLRSDPCLAEVKCVFEKNKSCVFILKDVDLDELTDVASSKLEIDISLLPHKVELSDHDSSTESKSAIITSLEKPELFEYTYSEGVPVLKIFNSGRVAVITKINCNDMRKVEIPQWVEHAGKRYRVGGIFYNVFQNNSTLEEVTIPNGWILLLSGAFTRCKSLHTVNLGTPKISGALKAGTLMDVFVDCPNLSKINKSKGTIILSGTFRNSQGIKSFDTQGYILSDRSFSGCVNLEKVSLSPKTRSLPERVFENCKALKTITIPKKIRTIEISAFKGCENLKEVIINTESKQLYFKETIDKSDYSHKKIRIYLDDLFESAEKFYIKKAPKFKIFKGDFKKTASDKADYSLFVRT